jgi:two-component system cell cycle sensor histidine kinase/response regulator CckA
MDSLALLQDLARVLAAALPADAVAEMRAILERAGFRAGEVASEVPEPVGAAVAELLRAAGQRALEHDELLRAKERARMLSEASFEGIMIHVDGSIIDANQPLVDMLRCTHEEVLGPETLPRSVAAEDLPIVLKRLRDRVEGAYVVTGVRRDGTRFRAEIQSKQGVYGERPVRVAAVRDVTERERINGLIRESESRLRELAQTAFDVLTYSRDGLIVDFVGDVEAIYGTPREKLIGRSVVDLIAPEYREHVRTHIQERQTGVFRSVLVGEQGEQIPVEIVAISTTLDGVPTRLSGVRDLRETVRIENERRKLEQHLQQSQRLDSLGVLAGGIAHDFNNLLVGIIGSAELLALADLRPEERECVDSISEAGQRAATLTAQLLAYAGRRDLGVREPVALNLVLSELRRLLGSSLSKRARVEIAIAEDAVVLGNRATLLQVLMNLLTNASDALGGEAGSITVGARRVGRPDERFQHALGAEVSAAGKAWVLVEVRDTGVGMDEATRGRIFEPFFSTKAKGHGLGLAACLGIVASHGGAIVVESALGRGSTFSVLLPAADSAPKKSPERAAAKAPGGRILVVDDESVVRRQVRRILEVHGYEVQEASNGDAALALIERDPPVLVLCDVTMPGMDGTEVVREMRARGSRVPIVLFSGYADFPLEQRLEPDAYAAFLAKPFTIEDLMATIRKALVP